MRKQLRIDADAPGDGKLHFRWPHVAGATRYFLQWSSDARNWYVCGMLEGARVKPDSKGELTYLIPLIEDDPGVYYRVLPVVGESDESLASAPTFVAAKDGKGAN